MRTLMTISILLVALTTKAQDWQLPWIGHAKADATAQVWFRKTFTLGDTPQSATISIASGGRFVAYVNGYNVTTDVLEPFLKGGVMEYDVSRFLRHGENTVAVWYSPIPPCTATAGQIAITLSWTDRTGQKQAIATDSTWLCRTANGRTTTEGDETTDGTDYVEGWDTGRCSPLDWDHAKAMPHSSSQQAGKWYKARHIAKIQNYSYLDDYGHTIVYHFRHRFDGWVRLTLRDMQRGDTISVNGLTYVCTGKSDEQACRRFTTSASSMAVVSGPLTFSRKNVANIEAISIDEYIHKSYRY